MHLHVDSCTSSNHLFCSDAYQLHATVLCPAGQLHICKQLAAFYSATNNINPVNGPWDEEGGWAQTSQQSCSKLLSAPSSGSQPSYCAWFGITCCSRAASAAGTCRNVNAVTALDLPLNNLNASIHDASFMQPLLQLHACGLKVANLEQNCFDGSISEDWGQMVNLELISLGECSPVHSIQQQGSSTWCSRAAACG
jgi:hypothetical protein